MIYHRPMSAETTFKIGRGGIFYMFAFIAVAGLGGSVLCAMGSEWLMAVALLAGGIFSAMLCVWMPGVLRIDDSGLEIQRRRGSQQLRWGDVERAIWSGGDGAAKLAVDNWVLTLHGQASGKKTTMVLSGPMVERQQEVRQLLAARFPPAQ